MSKFCDLFCGIGGFRIGLESYGHKSVYSCDRDKFCRKTYKHWFGESPAEDINKIDIEKIPSHDILTAGFPCQPFSISGVSKRNSLGMKHGFECQDQGNLFFKICDIAKIHMPDVLLLENVKNLKSYKKGNNWRIILESLRLIGYENIYHKVINASSWVPQNRERIFIVAFKDKNRRFSFPNPPTSRLYELEDVLEGSVDKKYILSDKMWRCLTNHKSRHTKSRNGFGYGLVKPNEVTRTLMSRYYKDGSEILIDRGKGLNPRRLTPVEAGRLMGFPEKYVQDIPVSDTQAYRQFGNSVVPKVVEAIVENL